MKTISFTCSKDDAFYLVKKTVSTKFAILKEKDYEVKVGAPMLNAWITIGDNSIYISGSNIVVQTCSNLIELELRNKKTNNDQVQQTDSIDAKIKAANYLKALKELLDSKIITEEEYNLMKDEQLSIIHGVQKDNQPKIHDGETIIAEEFAEDEPVNKSVSEDDGVNKVFIIILLCIGIVIFITMLIWFIISIK